MFDLKNLALNVEAETGGVWRDVGDGLKLKIARYGNPEYAREIKRLTSPYRHQIKNDLYPEEELKKLIARAVARTVLLGWEGLHVDGASVRYSSERAEEILEDPQYAAFLELVLNLSQDEAAYRFQEIKDEMGEPKRRTHGLENGADGKIS